MAIVHRGSRGAQQQQQQQQQGRQIVKIEDSDDSESRTELCQVGDDTAYLPFDLFQLPDLRNILSLDTWNFTLSEDEREQLLLLLPTELDQDTFSETLKDIFTGSNIFFGNPVTRLSEMMKGGYCQPRVVQFRQGLNCVERKEHYHLLRKYHNTMVNSFVEMQTLWDDYPDVEIDGRLEIWRKWKETKVKPQLPNPSHKPYNSVHKSKSKNPAAAASKVKDSSKPAGAGATGLKLSKGGLVHKSAKPKPLPPKPAPAPPAAAAVVVKVEAKVPSPVSEAETPAPNDYTVGGTSSSLTSGEKTRKRVRAESMSSLDEDEDFEDTGRSSSSMKRQVQCVANFESNNEDVDALKRRNRGKSSGEKESSESPPQNKLSRKVDVNLPFSILRFLSALRRALLVPFEGGAAAAGVDGAFTKNNNNSSSIGGASSPSEETGSDDVSRADFFPVPFSEVVRRVHASPGDAQVLDVQEPLQDLVWGALKVLSSKVAPAGAKGWRPLATYEKETKSWYWIGPPGSLNESGSTLTDDWGVASKILLKLEEAFAAWYKHGEATRQQMVQLQLPPPPVASAVVDERERFRDMRAQKSLITISPSSEDMRAYFRKEEMLRYSVPDRAFAYTRSDGRKSVVAPLRRGGGKPNSKARDHFMLKPDRPPHVTILCLVRDAAARLPGSVGTRADVCALIRDSQFVVEDVSEAQVNQVVSGALDRLHYERDPCVRFDSERKLWLYLHTDRNEDDFEDDGTSSTKRWKKQQQQQQRKEGGEGGEIQFDNDSPEDAGVGAAGFELGSSGIYAAGRAELVYNKNTSLTSPRVLQNRTQESGEEEEDDDEEGEGGMPSMELPPAALQMGPVPRVIIGD